jgi:hypothetical protein
VALSWKARGGELSTFDARDATGRSFGYVTNISGHWTVYLPPWACGRPGGLSTGPFDDAPAAITAAEAHIAAHAPEPPE